MEDTMIKFVKQIAAMYVRGASKIPPSMYWTI